MTSVWEFSAVLYSPEEIETPKRIDLLAATLETLNGSLQENMDAVVTFLRRRTVSNTEKRRQLAAAANATKSTKLKAARREDSFVTPYRRTLRQQSLRRCLHDRVASGFSAMEPTGNMAYNASS